MFELKFFNDINDEISSLRYEVFVEEQGIDESIEIEHDEYNYLHLCLTTDNQLAAYARAKACSGVFHIGRVLVKREYRGQGLGRKIMEYGEKIGLLNGCNIMELNAQHHAVSFYKKLGYIGQGEYFEEAKIPHLKMIKKI